MRFVVDAQLPLALARWLSANGCEAGHVFDHEMGHASDDDIWRFALGAGATIVTKDGDFALRKSLSGGGPPVVWIRLRNTRTRDLLVWFETILPDVLAALDRGEDVIEIT